MSFIEDLISAAESGDAEAQLSLGYCYDTGDGVKKSYKKLVYEGGKPRHCRRAAQSRYLLL